MDQNVGWLTNELKINIADASPFLFLPKTAKCPLHPLRYLGPQSVWKSWRHFVFCLRYVNNAVQVKRISYGARHLLST